MTAQLSSALVPFFFSIAMGYFAGKTNAGNMPIGSINKMLVDYALPFALFVYTAKMVRAELVSHLVPVAVIVIFMLVPYFASLVLSKHVFHVDPGRAAVRAVTVGMPNFAAIGLPLLVAVYGESSTLTVAFAITIASVVMSPACLILLERARGTERPGRPNAPPLAGALLNTFLKPVVLAPLGGMACSVLGWHLPTLIAQSLGIIGATTAGLALFSTGLILAALTIRLNLEVGVELLLGHIVQPLLAWFCVRLFSVPAPMAGQLVLLAAIPCGSFGILFGLGYDIDDPTAGATLVASSLLSAVTLTITISLLRFA
ncbi:auxin efflux carrier [Burkholderia lata]|uniref:AEC family transporter n=1 Tax=Burkholderia lata (strain ATCC 17760 / DSM 23089 / LMG 22485 / NCIMB 9086 / R18194 / 383) TaxID=482957 RepID=UPI00145311F0|nr:AEC family transporter [Burkholderia lata]VWB34260.1 auxin efflux carrier [Burkholderia lata]